MRAIRFDGAHAAFDSRAPEPRPARGEVVVRTRLVGVSALDVCVAQGRWRWPGADAAFRGILGNEFLGVVESGAPDAGAERLIGKRVVGSPDVVCGRCDLCRAGLSAQCRERTVLGVHGRDGCFAERFCIPARNLTPVPDSLADESAVLAAPAAAALQAVQRIHVEGKPFITVLGESEVALLAAQCASRLNASVRLVARAEAALAACERWGIRCRPEGEVGRRADQDVVIVCAPDSERLELALRLVRPRGKVVLASPCLSACPALDLTPLVVGEIDLIGSRSAPVGDGLALLAAGRADASGLVVRRVRLEDGLGALRPEEDPGHVKVVIDV